MHAGLKLYLQRVSTIEGSSAWLGLMNNIIVLLNRDSMTLIVLLMHSIAATSSYLAISLVTVC